MQRGFPSNKILKDAVITNVSLKPFPLSLTLQIRDTYPTQKSLVLRANYTCTICIYAHFFLRFGKCGQSPDVHIDLNINMCDVTSQTAHVNSI